MDMWHNFCKKRKTYKLKDFLIHLEFWIRLPVMLKLNV